MSAVTFTNFDRAAQPNGLLSVFDWRKLAQSWLGSGEPWKAARAWARERGAAMVQREDDSLVVFDLKADGKVRQRTFKPGTWGWA